MNTSWALCTITSVMPTTNTPRDLSCQKISKCMNEKLGVPHECLKGLHILCGSSAADHTPSHYKFLREGSITTSPAGTVPKYEHDRKYWNSCLVASTWAKICSMARGMMPALCAHFNPNQRIISHHAVRIPHCRLKEKHLLPHWSLLRQAWCESCRCQSAH